MILILSMKNKEITEVHMIFPLFGKKIDLFLEIGLIVFFLKHY